MDRAFALAVSFERDLCADLADAEREQLLELLQRVGTRLGLPSGGMALGGYRALRAHG